MATQTDELILKTQGEQEVKRLAAALEAAEQTLQLTVAAANKASAGSAQFSTAVQTAAADVLSYQTALKTAQVAQLQAGAASGALTSALTTVSFSLDDAQQFGVSTAAGFRALSNNWFQLVQVGQTLAQVGIGGVTSALAGPAGLILALTAGGIAAGQLSKHWGEIENTLGIGFPTPVLEGAERFTADLKKLGDELDKLQAKKRVDLAEKFRIGDLRQQIADLKEQQKAAKELEDITTAPSKAERAAGAGFKEAVAESGGKTALDALTDSLSNFADARGKVASPLGGVGSPEEIAKSLFVAAGRGDAFARDQIRQYVGRDTDFGKAIFEKSPDEKVRDELNKQGIENEAAAAEESARERTRTASQFASSFSGGALGAQALALPGQVGRDRIRDALTQSGLTSDVANKIVGDVYVQFTDSIREAIQKRAADKGITDAQARTELLGERLDSLSKAAKGGDESALAQLKGLGVSAGDISALQGPLSKAQTFGSGVDLAKFTQESVLNQGGEAKEHTRLLGRIATAVEKKADEKANPPVEGIATFAGPD